MLVRFATAKPGIGGAAFAVLLAIQGRRKAAPDRSECFSLITNWSHGSPRPVVRAIGGLPALPLSALLPKLVTSESVVSGALKLKPCRQPGEPRVAARAPQVTQPPSGSMAEKEETQRQGWALSLVNIADVVRDNSSVLQSWDGLTPDRLAFLSKDRAPSTLKKHLQ